METKKRLKNKSNDQIKLINYQRAIFVQGNLDDNLVANLTPKIVSLRKNSRSPITVFIDSPGGSVTSAEIIRGLLKTPDQMGRTCWVNTVVTGQACSAGADLLASGDYIISYPNAYIHFHGIRARAEEITVEQAGNLQEELMSLNKSTAVRLAVTVFDRMLLNYLKVRAQLHLMRDVLGDQLDNFNILLGDGTIDVPAFIFYLLEKVKEPYKNILIDCIHKTSKMSLIVKKFQEEAENQRQLPPIVRATLKKVGEEEESESKMSISEELILLNVLLANKIKENPNWRLTTQDFNELEQDFLQLNAMIDAGDEVCDRLRKFVDLFMPPKDQKFFQKYTYEDTCDPKIKAKVDEILDRAYAKIEPLWSFSLSLCRSLSIGENPISPGDAWWLGLIDEVLGSPSLTRRTIRTDVKYRLISMIPTSDFDKLVDY
jgi:ATP-dependent protease ClpP protease subunit